MKIPEGAVISHRQKTSVPNHHLWNNHGIWWFHATIHLPDNTSERLRFSLATKDVTVARRNRDALLNREKAIDVLEPGEGENRRLSRTPLFLFGPIIHGSNPRDFAKSVMNALRPHSIENADGSLDLTPLIERRRKEWEQ